MTTPDPAADGHVRASILAGEHDGAPPLVVLPERADDKPGSVHAPILLFCAVFAWTYYLSALVSPRYFGIGVDNFWFDADVPRYVCQSVDAFANDHWRNKVHPLFSLMVWPLPNALHLLGIDFVTGIRLQTALVTAIGMLFLYLALRRLALTAAVAALLIAFTATGASVMTWFAITESYAYTFAAVAMMFHLLAGDRLAGWRSRQGRSLQWAVGIGLAFAVTISNIVLAALLAFQALGLRRAIKVGALAVAAVGVLAVAQRLLFPSSGVFFLPSALGGESAFMHALSAGRLRELFAIVFFGSFVFLDVKQVPSGGGQTLTVQHATTSSDTLATVSLVLLGILYLAGLYPLLRRLGSGARHAWTGNGASQGEPEREPATLVAMPVLGGIVFLLMLHSVYGKETFLYTGSFLPFLTIILGIALGSPFIRRRRLAIPILAFLLAGNIVHNYPAWRAAVTSLQQAAQQPVPQKALNRNTCSFVKRNLLS